MIFDQQDFILQHTRLSSPSLLPEIQLYLADAVTPLWHMTEAELGARGLPPPFWAFAWVGGQAVARYLLDHPAPVAGRRVLDFASGSGLCAIAAAKAGASAVTAADIDPFSAAAVALNAAANGVTVGFLGTDLLAADPPAADVILAGDICYEGPLAARVLLWLRTAHALGTQILLGDPGRTYLPPTGLVPLATYEVPTTRDLEDADLKPATVYTFGP